MTPGEVIRAERLKRGWTQKELARRVGRIDHSGVSNIEQGKTQLGRARAERFARVLDVSVDRLLPSGDGAPTTRTILRHLRDSEERADFGRNALVESLESIDDRLSEIEALLRQLGGRGRAAVT
jgi:transcriptional regulator with XRE-family HTH domain